MSQLHARLNDAAHTAATGRNNMPEPTPAQRLAGNYLMGRFRLHGLDVRIENPEGTFREGTDTDGQPWRTRLAAHYGYFAGTRGADGDPVDVFIGVLPESPHVWVVNQVEPSTGAFDEHKVMLGFGTEDLARAGYLGSYTPGWQGLGSMVRITLAQLRWWLKSGDRTAPIRSAADLLSAPEPKKESNMKPVQWDNNTAQPRGQTIGKVLYDIRLDDAGDDLMTDPMTMDDMLSDPDIDSLLVFDALVVEAGMLKTKTDQILTVLKAAGQTVQPQQVEIGEPVRLKGTMQIPVIYGMSDGQTLAIWFHNPDTTPAKLAPMDVLVSARWVINKKDVTIVVAPEKGKDLSPRDVARRIMTLVEKNSAAFQRVNAKAGERAAQIEGLQGEIAGLEQTLDGLKVQIERAQEVKASAAAKALTKPAPQKPAKIKTPKQFDLSGRVGMISALKAAGYAATDKESSKAQGFGDVAVRLQSAPHAIEVVVSLSRLAGTWSYSDLSSEKPANEADQEAIAKFKSDFALIIGGSAPDSQNMHQSAAPKVGAVPAAPAAALPVDAAAAAPEPAATAPKPNYKAGDRLTPDLDVFEGDIVRHDRKLWMAKVKRGTTVPLAPIVDGKPVVNSDSVIRVDLLSNEVVHTGANVYGHGGQPTSTPENPAAPAPSHEPKIPPGVANMVKMLVERMVQTKQFLVDTERASGNGFGLTMAWHGVKDETETRLGKLKTLREKAADKGLTTQMDLLITEFGGVPDFGMYRTPDEVRAAEDAAKPVDLTALSDLELETRLGNLGTKRLGMRPGSHSIAEMEDIEGQMRAAALERERRHPAAAPAPATNPASDAPPGIPLETDEDDLSTPDGRYLSGQLAFQRGVPEGNRPRLIGLSDWLRGYEDAKSASPQNVDAGPAADLFGDAQPEALTPEGAESKVKTAKGTEVLTGYSVIEADRLITSHDPSTGDANPAFPPELQPRDRGRDASIAWVRKTANDLDPDLLGKSRRADSGAPIIGPDGVVESGNGRTMAVVLAYQSGKADDYRAWLEDEAGYFGLKPEKVKAMRRPVLVRIRTSKVDRSAFAIEANQSDTLAMTATEKAKSDARRMDDGMIALMTENGDLAAAENVPFLSAFLRTLGEAEAAQYSTSDGKPTSTLIARVQAAIFSKAYADDRLLELLADTAKPEIANLVKALNNAAPEFIQAAAMDPEATSAATGKLTDAVEKSLNQKAVDALLGASNVIRQAKDAGQSVDEFVSQAGLFGDIDPDVAAMAVFIAKNNRSAKRMGEAFKAMATFIKGEIQRRQTGDMFGDNEPVAFADIVAAANRELERMYGPGVETIGLFDRPAAEAPASDPAPAAEAPEPDAQEPEPEVDPVAAVNAAYTFDKATDDFKALLADSIDATDYSEFATAKAIDQAVKAAGGTVSWSLVVGAILDSVAEMSDGWEMDEPSEYEGAFDSVSGGEPQGVIRKGAKILGRAVFGGDGKAMIYVGKAGADRVLVDGRRAIWGEEPQALVSALFSMAATPTEPKVRKVSKKDAAKAADQLEFVVNDLSGKTQRELVSGADIHRRRIGDAVAAVEALKSGWPADVTFPQSTIEAAQQWLTSIAAAEAKGDDLILGAGDVKTMAMNAGVPESLWPAILANPASTRTSGSIVVPSYRMGAIKAAISSAKAGPAAPVEPAAAPVDAPRNADAAFLRSVIDKTAPGLLDPATADEIEAIMGRHPDDAEIDTLAGQAIDAYMAAAMEATAGLK